jgi:hypothetical protein
MISHFEETERVNTHTLGWIPHSQLSKIYCRLSHSNPFRHPSTSDLLIPHTSLAIGGLTNDSILRLQRAKVSEVLPSFIQITWTYCVSPRCPISRSLRRNLNDANRSSGCRMAAHLLVSVPLLGLSHVTVTNCIISSCHESTDLR